MPASMVTTTVEILTIAEKKGKRNAPTSACVQQAILDTVVDTGGFFPKDGKTRLTLDLRLTLDQTKYLTVTAEEMLMNFARVLNQGKNKSDELTNKPDAMCGGGPRVLNSKA